jgi:gamma-glutamylcyclotransferase
MKYFAYGSNMSLARLRGRVPGAIRLGVFFLDEHDLRFHKTGKDGSGKCDAFHTRNTSHSVIGALFEIDRNEKKVLDKVEGLGYGYEEKSVRVHDGNGDSHVAVTYCAIRMNPALRPYSWYLNHVVVGAQETKVPPEYLDRIRAVDSAEDPDEERDTEQRAIYCSGEQILDTTEIGRGNEHRLLD